MLLLVALLLFLPIAQAQHLLTHSLNISDIECQVCHSHVDIEGEKPQNRQLMTLTPASFSVTVSLPEKLPTTTHYHTAIRAPPHILRSC